ncbi:hypothetical protein EDB83DRAFT_2399131, partial [Lactarius deliciosus]
SCFSSAWLDARAENDSEDRTNREVQIMHHNERALVTRTQKPLGLVSQLWAGLMHHVEAERLAQISKSIPKVLILTGDQDHAVRPSNSAYLSERMPEAEYVVWKETGHAVQLQHAERFNSLLERVFLEGQAKVGSLGSGTVECEVERGRAGLNISVYVSVAPCRWTRA